MGSTPRTKIRTQNVDLATISKDYPSEVIRCLVEIRSLPLTSLPNFLTDSGSVFSELLCEKNTSILFKQIHYGFPAVGSRARILDRFRPWQQVHSSRRERTVLPALRRELLRAGENLRY